jgi:hypothetical protein
MTNGSALSPNAHSGRDRPRLTPRPVVSPEMATPEHEATTAVGITAVEHGNGKATPASRNETGTVEASPDRVQKLTAVMRGKATKKRFLVEQIKSGKKDNQGRKVTFTFAIRPEMYAIYWADDTHKVCVHYANDPRMEVDQRARVLSSVGRARAEITALLQDRDRPGIYDRKVAIALELALEGKVDCARFLIEEVKADLIKERAAAGRLQYLTCTAASFGVLMVSLIAAGIWWRFPTHADNLWLAAEAGLVGAAFSIALAVRRRTVALDTDLRSNVTDGILRLVIGAVSGGLLLLLFSSGIVPPLKLGEILLTPWSSDVSWKAVLLLGFVAGFLERLVPDLLDKARAQPLGAPDKHN